MKVVQILPELNSGGVERGTLEIASFLVRKGHEALVVSNGGRMVGELEASGARHVTMPVHRKHPVSLLQVRVLRRFLAAEKPDILHIRSRVPGWIAWLAWRGMDPKTRPRLVSTVHGFYSVNAYSAIMTKGERVIAVSESVREYILHKYPKTAPATIRTIHRGVDPVAYHPAHQPPAAWTDSWRRDHPQLHGKQVLLLPARITRWKGQEDFLSLIADLKRSGRRVHGLLAGEAHRSKQSFLRELQTMTATLGINDDVTFLGHRTDLREVMASSDLVLSLSRDPEAFGRVSLEAMALGKQVLAYAHGGVGEQLTALFPQGAVPPRDTRALASACERLLDSGERPRAVTAPFTLESMCRSTTEVYSELSTAPRPSS